MTSLVTRPFIGWEKLLNFEKLDYVMLVLYTNVSRTLSPLVMFIFRPEHPMML